MQAPPAAAKTPQRKASGQKKPLEALGSSPPPSRYIQCFFLVKNFVMFYLRLFYILPAKSKRHPEVSMNKALTSLMMSLQLVVLIWGYMSSYASVIFICFVMLCYLSFEQFWSNNSLCLLPGRRGTAFLCSEGWDSSFRSCSESCSTRRRKAHSTEGTPDKEISRNQLIPPSFKFYLIKQKSFAIYSLTTLFWQWGNVI